MTRTKLIGKPHTPHPAAKQQSQTRPNSRHFLLRPSRFHRPLTCEFYPGNAYFPGKRVGAPNACATFLKPSVFPTSFSPLKDTCYVLQYCKQEAWRYRSPATGRLAALGASAATTARPPPPPCRCTLDRRTSQTQSRHEPLRTDCEASKHTTSPTSIPDVQLRKGHAHLHRAAFQSAGSRGWPDWGLPGLRPLLRHWAVCYMEPPWTPSPSKAFCTASNKARQLGSLSNQKRAA